MHHDRSAANAGGERTSVLETTTASFAEHKGLLFSVVYNLLGSVSDTEDVLQDTWLAWASSGREEVANARAYLLRIAVNQALSRLRRARRSREAYLGPWLPEPLATGTDGPDSAERAEAVSMAMLVVLETLTPLERTVFVLHEVFGYEHAEIAAILGRRPAAVRQLAHRAREHVQARRPRYQPDPSAQRAATERFLAAAVGGDLTALLEVLAPDVTLWGDGGGRFGGAARRVVQGRDKVARLLATGAARYRTADLVVDYAEVNGGPAALVFMGGQLVGVVVVDLTEQGDRVRAVYSVFNPDKLTAVAGAVRPTVQQTATLNTGGNSVQSSPSSSTTLSIPQLRAALNGRVIAPGDPGYDQTRALFTGGFEDLRPAVIVRVADAADVARVAALARETGLELAVRSGGHSGAGHSSTDGGIVLDLRDMTALEIDPQTRTAWAETGLSAAAYSSAAAGYGLATGFGDTGSVGIGGITLGGGIGYLVRKHGLTVDNLLAADLVTADGRLLRTDDEHHPDLFWAIRGGGGNFGVATRFKYRLHPVPSIVGGMLLLPASAGVVAEFIALAEAAPEELSMIANVMPAPPLPFVPAEQHGQLVILAIMAYAGPTEAGERAVAPFRALAAPIADMVRPMPYPEIYPPEDPDYHPTAVSHTMFVDAVDRGLADTIMEHLEASDAPMRAAQLRVLGGAMARVPAEATAFAHRRSRIMVNLAAFYDGSADRAVRRAWVDQFAAALQQGDTGAYVGFLVDEGEERVRKAYPGSTWERLAAVKARYDPSNLFHRNQNVTPRPPAPADPT